MGKLCACNRICTRFVQTLHSFVIVRNFFYKIYVNYFMVEPLLSGIVLGLIPVTLLGLFVTAYLQYRRGDRVTSEF